MTPQQILDEFRENFRSRRFVAGLLIAIIDFLKELDALGGEYSSFRELTDKFEQQTTTRAGKSANTLIVKVGATTKSLRPSYNAAEELFRVTNKRFDYPSAAPHATQAWGDYLHWIDALLGFSEEQALSVREAVIEHVLEELPSHEVDPSTIRPLARPFTDLLENFEIAAKKGEKQGAVFQGMIFAYIRADSPHLFLEVAKVGAGSKRLQRVGDIDGWQGEQLVISAEVKSYHLDKASAVSLGVFFGEVTNRRALPIVAAHSFSDEARVHLQSAGVRVLDLSRLRSLVDLWDPLKQQAALEGFTYYVHHVEKNSPLMQRLADFRASTQPSESPQPTDDNTRNVAEGEGSYGASGQV